MFQLFMTKIFNIKIIVSYLLITYFVYTIIKQEFDFLNVYKQVK